MSRLCIFSINIHQVNLCLSRFFYSSHVLNRKLANYREPSIDHHNSSDTCKMSSSKKMRNSDSNPQMGENPNGTDQQSGASVPPSSVFRDQVTYLEVTRWNEAIMNLSSRPGVPDNQQPWSPYSHLFFNGRPSPIFYDYRQMFAGVTTAGSGRFWADTRYQQVRTASVNAKIRVAENERGRASAELDFDIEVKSTTTVRKEKKEVTLAKEIVKSSVMPCEIGGLRRRWTPLMKRSSSRESISPNNDTKFTVCSYNVLCQSTLLETPHLYTHCMADYLAWNYRWLLLQKEFSVLNADVYCLQEVEESFYESHYLKFFQSRGYDGLHKRRMGGKLDGCAIFWRRDRFDLAFSDSMHYQVPNSILDRDNIALIVKLALKPASPREGKKAGGENSVILANTHLLFNPGRGDIKLCQVAMLLAKLQKICHTSKTEDGLIMCGDFNSVPFSPLYNFLMEGRLHYVGLRRAEISGQLKRGGPPLQYPLLPGASNIDENTCTEGYDCDDDIVIDEPGCLAHPLKFVSAYGHYMGNGIPEVSTHHSKDSSNVDYIFYKVNSKTVAKKEQSVPSTSWTNSTLVELVTKDFKEQRLKCRAVLSLPSSDQIKRTVGWLPNQYCASDHLPLMAEFEFL